MTARRDHYRDPDAPEPNSLVPGGSALVVVDDAAVLMQRRSDSGNWSFPGGIMEIGETLAQCVVRETKEETGIDIEITGIVGTYTNPDHVFAYDNGEVRQEFSICLLGRPLDGTIRVSDESTEVAWFDTGEIDALPMVASIRKRIDDWRSGRAPIVR